MSAHICPGNIHYFLVLDESSLSKKKKYWMTVRNKTMADEKLRTHGTQHAKRNEKKAATIFVLVDIK